MLGNKMFHFYRENIIKRVNFMAKFRIALIAHDQMKDRMVAWAEKHRAQLAQCDIVSTGTTGGRIMERCPELEITRMKSGPLGGDQQIGALIAEGRIDGLVFFVDPLSGAREFFLMVIFNRLRARKMAD